MSKTKHLDFWEHFSGDGLDCDFLQLDWSMIANKPFAGSRDRFCFRKHSHGQSYRLGTDYFIGVDWLIKDELSLYVAPKVNTRFSASFDLEGVQEKQTQDTKPDFRELNFLAMLDTCMGQEQVLASTSGLVSIDWDAPQIPIKQEQDLLSPFLIVQFVGILKRIVRKGLKKSYYKKTQNLNGRVKGKILVGENLRTNLVKNNLTKTVCSFQEFGIDTQENRFLKKVMLFCLNYTDNHKVLFHGVYHELKTALAFCRPAFESISTTVDERLLKQTKTNVFYSEYKDALRLGGLILKRFGYNITQTSPEQLKTPPFWIDMPKLFELYVYSKLLKLFPSKNELLFQFSTYGNALDFLINTTEVQMVVDAKYKLAYSDSMVHQDIRQVSGYARLNKVFSKLGIQEDRLLDCLLIYPDFTASEDLVWNKITEIKEYRKVFKLGIRLPITGTPS